MIDWLTSVGIPGADLSDNRLGAWAMDCCYSEISMRCRGGPPQIQFQPWPNDFYKLLFDEHSTSSYNSVNLGNLDRVRSTGVLRERRLPPHPSARWLGR